MELDEFKQRPNNHQQHMDSLVTLGPEGLEEINDKIDKFIAGLDGDEQQLNTTTKIDGSPAVVCWSKFEDYPDNSICLKSFLTSNKNCLSSMTDIQDKYGDRPDMANKLMYCLELAKTIPAGEAWQGDCLFTKENLMEAEIDGQEYLVFQPNKIVYAFSEDNHTYETIKNSDFGICFHTIYKGNLESKSQSFRVDASRLSNVPDGIYVMSPALNAPKDKSAYGTDEIIKKYDALKTVEGKLLSNDSFEELCSNKAFKSYWDLFENANLSDKQATTINLSTFYGDLLDFIHSRMKNEYDKKIAGLKTEKGKESATEKYNQSLVELDLLLDNNKSIITNMVAALNLVADIKMLMWGGFKQSKQDYKTFYNTKSRGYIPADMEGVALSDMDGNIVKVVDRSTFSHANRSDDYISGFQHESLDEGSKDSMYTFDDFLGDDFEIKVGDKSLGKVKGKDFASDEREEPDYSFDDFLDDEFEIKVGDKSLGKVKGKDFAKESLQEGNSLGRLFTHMNDGVNFAIIGSLDKDDITESHWNELLDLSINNYKLLDKLERANRRVSWKYLTGRYTMESTGETITEKSIILYNITREVADHLAQSINQESYIWKDDDFFGFVYTDGHEENIFSRTNLDLNREHLNDFASRLVSKHAEGQDFAFSINEVMSKPGRHQVIRPGDIWEEPLFKYYSDEDKQAFYECYGE